MASTNYEGAPPSTNLFVGNISYRATAESFGAFLAEMNIDPITIKILTCRETGRSKGCLFLDFETIEEATAALERWSGVVYDSRELHVAYARPRRPGR